MIYLARTLPSLHIPRLIFPVRNERFPTENTLHSYWVKVMCKTIAHQGKPPARRPTHKNIQYNQLQSIKHTLKCITFTSIRLKHGDTHYQLVFSFECRLPPVTSSARFPTKSSITCQFIVETTRQVVDSHVNFILRLFSQRFMEQLLMILDRPEHLLLLECLF
jgi:hypothetical protein